MEAVVPVLFYGKPGDLVRVQRSDWDRNGSWRVVEASVQADEAGGTDPAGAGGPRRCDMR